MTADIHFTRDDVPPVCPLCGNLPWRPGRLRIAAWRSLLADGGFTVCMHCSSIWRVGRDGAGPFWTRPSSAELAELEETLGPVQQRFAQMRATGTLPK